MFAEVTCDLCGKTVRDNKKCRTKLIDGVVCRQCLANNGIADLPASGCASLSYVTGSADLNQFDDSISGDISFESPSSDIRADAEESMTPNLYVCISSSKKLRSMALSS